MLMTWVLTLLEPIHNMKVPSLPIRMTGSWGVFDRKLEESHVLFNYYFDKH